MIDKNLELLNLIKQQLVINPEGFKINAKKLLSDFFSVNQKISQKKKEEIQEFDKLLEDNKICLTYRNFRKKSILSFRDKNYNYKQITFCYLNENIMNNIANDKNWGKIERANGNNQDLRPYQQTAIQQLNKALEKKSFRNLKGLLVIPTGGGKTFIAVYWLLKNKIDKGAKVLWIAHRYTLLDQAFETFFDCAYTDVLKERNSFKYGIISGVHGRAVNLKNEDWQDIDLLIAGKDSIQSNSLDLVIQNWAKQQKEIFLVIDEAHRATAKTYRKIISEFEKLSQKGLIFNTLGLTATPLRTAKNEEGLIRKMFPDDVIDGNTNLKQLIDKGFLAKPEFKEIKTKLDLSNQLTGYQIKQIGLNDTLPPDIRERITKDAERNKLIANTYEKEIHGKTIIFAIDRIHAIELKGVFEKKLGKGKVECVISDTREQYTNATNREENTIIIKKFKENQFDILINVNILTEGIDIPDIKSIFLTRPTTSTILMTQMIGRGLRRKGTGENKALIVSFIDNWDDKIYWENPEKVYINTDVVFDDKNKENYERQVRLISISKIEEFARMLDEQIPEFENIDFIDRIPIGFYSFPLDDKHCDILVYQNLLSNYQNFVNNLIDYSAEFEEKENLKEDELDFYASEIERIYFNNCERFGYSEKDIKDILQYYALNSEKPTFITFEQRDKFNLDNEVKIIKDKDMRESEKASHILNLWNNDTKIWKVLFGDNEEGFKYFRRQIMIGLDKLYNPESYENKLIPRIEYKRKNPEDCNLFELRKLYPNDYEFIKYELIKTHGISKSDFGKYQIDHITRLKDGGKTLLKNLQLLTRDEHRKKTQSENFNDRNFNGIDII